MMMEGHEEDGEILEVQEARHHSRHHRDEEDEEFSMSSFDGDQGDALDIKPPQAVVPRREKREKRDKRDRHRHKGDRSKSRSHSRGQPRDERGERVRREHRKHREHDPERQAAREARDPERQAAREAREARRHEKQHRERTTKHERPAGDLRNKLQKRKIGDKDIVDRQRSNSNRDEYYLEQRDPYYRQDEHRLHRRGASGEGGIVRGGGGSGDYSGYSSGRSSGQPDERLTQLSPRSREERERRMARFLDADKAKEQQVRELEQIRYQREEERRRKALGHRGRPEGGHSRQHGQQQPYRDYRDETPERIEARKKRKNAHYPELQYADGSDEVTVVSEDEEDMIDDDEEGEDGEYDEMPRSRKSTDPEQDHKREDMNKSNKGENEENQDSESGSGSSDSESDSVTNLYDVAAVEQSSHRRESDGSRGSGESSSESEDEDDEEGSKKNGNEKKAGAAGRSPQSHSESGSDSERSRTPTTPRQDGGRYDDSPRSDRRSDLEEAAYLGNTPPKSPLEMKTETPKLPNYYPAIMGCRSVDEFECLNRIEEGTYGVVYRAKEKATTTIVALKRLKMEKEKEGFPITSLREVNTLLKGQHKNIVTVREIVVGSNMDKIYIVMDYVEHDLKSLMETMRAKKQMFTIAEVKTLMIQLLCAVHHLHDNWILHRDLKTSNLLLSHRGILKVGDFGLAREYGSPLKQYTSIVVTLWYRAPELLLGTKMYSTPIDVWSCGCIFGELLAMEPMFTGKSEIDQLNKIYKDLGSPSEKIWPGYKDLPVVKKTQFADYPYNHLREKFKTRLSDGGFALLNKFLTYNPAKRISAQEALVNDYFETEMPGPIDPAMFPTWPAKSENSQSRSKKTGTSPKPPSGGQQFKDLGDGQDEKAAAHGFFLGGQGIQGGAGFTLKF